MDRTDRQFAGPRRRSLPSSTGSSLARPARVTAVVLAAMTLPLVLALATPPAEASPLGVNPGPDQAVAHQQVGFTVSEGSAMVPIAPWDPALGVSLDEVHISLTGELLDSGAGGDPGAVVEFDANAPGSDGFSFERDLGQFTFDPGEGPSFVGEFELDFAFDFITDFNGLTFPTHAAGAGFDPPVVVLGWREGFVGNPGGDIEQILTFTEPGGGTPMSSIGGEGQLDVTYLYTVPEPGTAALLALAGAVLLSGRSRRRGTAAHAAG